MYDWFAITPSPSCSCGKDRRGRGCHKRADDRANRVPDVKSRMGEKPYGQVARAGTGRRRSCRRGAEPDAGKPQACAAASAETAAPKTTSGSAPTPTQAPKPPRVSHHRGPILAATGSPGRAGRRAQAQKAEGGAERVLGELRRIGARR